MLTYNAAAYVRMALDSVLRQVVTFPVEIIVGDDCSTDGTQDIVREYAARHPGTFRLHLHATKGAGVAGRVNNMTNLAACRGEYIAMLDGDDAWLRDDKLALQVAFLDANPRYSIVSTRGLEDREGVLRAFVIDDAILGGADVTLATVAETAVTNLLPSAILLRREWLLPLPAYFAQVYVADYYMMLILLERGPARVLSVDGFLYRRHAANFSNLFLSPGEHALRLYDDKRFMRATFPALEGAKALRALELELLADGARYGLRSGSLATGLTTGLGVVGRVLRRNPVEVFRYVRQHLAARRARKTTVGALGTDAAPSSTAAEPERGL